MTDNRVIRLLTESNNLLLKALELNNQAFELQCKTADGWLPISIASKEVRLAQTTIRSLVTQGKVKGKKKEGSLMLVCMNDLYNTISKSTRLQTAQLKEA